MRTVYEFVEYERNIPGKIVLKDMNAFEFQVPAHWHESVEFDLMLRGNAQCIINGKEEHADCGSFLFINSGDIHRIDVKDTKGRYGSVVVLLSYDFLKQQFQEMDDYYFHIPSQGPAAEKITRLLFAVGQMYEKKPCFYETRISSLLTELCYVLLSSCLMKKENIHPGKRTEKSECAKKAIAYVDSRYKEKIEVSVAAAHVGLQKNYFCRYFKDKTGDTFIQFLNKVRLYHALGQYLEGNGTALECALNNGFSDEQAFVRTCKRVHGCTPKEYKKIRNSLKEIHRLELRQD